MSKTWRRCAAVLVAAVAVVLLSAVAAQAATLSGTVKYGRDTHEMELFGATVTAVDPASGRAVATTTTDALGGYTLMLADGVYDVTFAATGMRARSFDALGLAGRASTLDVTLVQDGWFRLDGTVADSSGPLDGVAVDFGGFRTTTGSDGRFVLYVWLWPGSFDLTLTRDDWTFTSTGLAFGDDREIAVTLPARTGFSVHAYDGKTLRGVPRATVRLPELTRELLFDDGRLSGRLTTAEAVATTDSAGVASFSVFPDSRPFESRSGSVEPSTPRYEAQWFSPSGTSAEVSLYRLARVSGTVSDASGPLAGVEIGGRDPSHRTLTAADGSFDVYVWESELFFITEPGMSGPWLRVDLVRDLLRDRVVDLVVPQRTGIVVNVVDGAGDPVEGAVVRLPSLVAELDFGGGVTGSTYHYGLVGTTSAYGQAGFTVHPGARRADGEPLGTVEPPPGSRLPAAEFDLEGASTTVVLADEPGLVALNGRITLGDRVSGAAVTLGGERRVTDAEGGFAFAVASGRYPFAATWTDAAGGAWSLDGELDMSEDRSIDFRSGTVPVVVQVRDGDGDPVEGATVALPGYRDAEPFWQAPGIALGVTPGAVVTGADGDVTVQLPPGALPQARTGLVTPPRGSRAAAVAFGAPDLGGWPIPAVTVTLAEPVEEPAPAVALTVSPDPLVSGDWWTVSRVAVQVTATDSDVSALACSVDGVTRTFAQTRTATTISGTFYVNLEGRHTAGCTALDRLGHSATQTRAVNLDLKNPAAPTASADRPADDLVYGWHRDAVTVSFAANGDPLLADGSAGSGVDPASAPASQTFGRSGTFTAAGTVSDVAGRTSSAGRLTVKVDADAPTSTLICPAGPVTLGASASARWSDSDGQSGLASGTSAAGTVALDTSSVGDYAVAHTALDKVGHRTSSACRYRVVYAYVLRGGLDAPPALNAVAPGVTTQVVWFSIGGDHGLAIGVRETLTVQPVACGGGAPIGSAFPGTLSTALQYDAATSRYKISWSVADDLPSGCAALRFTLSDGVEREVLFAR